MNEFLEKTYYNNTVQDYLIVIGGILVALSIMRLFKGIVITRLKKWAASTANHVDDYVITTIDKFIIPAVYAWIVYFGLSYLTLHPRVQDILSVAITVMVTFLVIRFVSSTILQLLRHYVRRQENGEEKVKQLGGVILIINVFIWVMGLLFFFDNMGYDITAVIAGLGIGGIAIALAAQNILGDLFNYFVIFFDRPFEVGDFLIIDDKLGVVEYIGIKTTRIKSLSGEQLVFSNSDLTGSRIHNYKRMQRRRVLFNIGVTYQTSYENLKRIPGVLKSAVEDQENVEFDRAHFKAYGNSSLDFEIVYYVLSSDYNIYMDIQQAINFRIFEEFKKMDVEIAYPTRTLYLMNGDGEKMTGDEAMNWSAQNRNQ
ncbi:Potassium efflux system KefA protein [Fulvivirga imtechensis AK7]|uniref:Potassium efflux system KefA protein n=2 Tax=Fulvivirga TaxID=396811 RepID=L8JQQ0_9BACT|nr:Potassium efflux system KefA protein [Fulvivirga imtechensis AK7]